MNAIYDKGRPVRHLSRLRRLVPGMLPSALAVMCAAAPFSARADVIMKYNLNVVAEVSSYCCAVHGDFITLTGQFLFDSTLGKITSVDLTATGNLQTSTLPVAGVSLNVTNAANETAHDLFAQSSDGAYQVRFQFVNALDAAGTFDAIAVQPYTDNGDAYFSSANDGLGNYHIGYFSTTGGAVPEPGSFLLLGGSLIGLAFIRRRFAGKRLAV